MRKDPPIIVKTLKKNNMLVMQTARELGVHRATVYRWIIKSENCYSYNYERSHIGIDLKIPYEVSHMSC